MSGLKAYSVHEGDPGECAVLVFAKNSHEARVLGWQSGILSDGDYMGVRAERRKEIDNLADEAGHGVVHDYAIMLRAGWHFECNGCGHSGVDADGCWRCTDTCAKHPDGCDGEGHDSPFVEGNGIYCTRACHEHRVAEEAAEKARTDALREKVLAKYPGVVIEHVDYRGDGVHFKFPGGKGSVRWVVGETTISVAPIDFDAWAAFSGKPIDFEGMSEQGRTAYESLVAKARMTPRREEGE